VKDDRELCLNCGAYLSFISLRKNSFPDPGNQVNEYTLNEIKELYSDNKEYKTRIDTCKSLLRKIKKLQKSVFGKSEKDKIKEIKNQYKFYRKIIKESKKRFLKNITTTNDYKELKQLSSQLKKIDSNLKDTYGTDFYDYLKTTSLRRRRYVGFSFFFENINALYFVKRRLRL